MNHVRASLAAGVPAEQQQAFREYVRGTVAQVERICQDHRSRPGELPPQTLAAYRYLKALDLHNLPLPPDGQPTGLPLRIGNLVAATTRLRAALRRLAIPPEPDPEELDRLHAIIVERVAATDRLAAQQATTPATLPAPSRRAYAWLSFLSDLEILRQHVATLAALNALVRAAARRSDRPVATRRLPLVVDLYHIAPLYRARREAEGWQLTASELFVGAPAEVLQALVLAGLDVQVEGQLPSLRAYADSEEAAEVQVALAVAEGEPPLAASGQHCDLDVVFDRVNAACFGGRLSRPRLVWSRGHTQRKMGHYQFASDTVMLSVTLDDARVPEYVVDFVMYHELVHRVLGAPMVGGRVRSHTPEFRRREREFPDYERAQRWLGRRR